MKELKLKVVFSLIHDSKKHLSDLRNSVGPVTSGSLDKVDTFLKDLEREVEPSLPGRRLIRRSALIVAFGFLLAFTRLLIELSPEVIRVIMHHLVK